MYILRKFVGSPILRGLANHNGKSYFAVFSTKALTSDEKRSALNKLNENSNGISKWKQTDDGRDAIQKLFEFADFSQAWGFMSKCSLIAEKLDHHPEWFNVYNRVDVTLTTHDANGVSEKDIQMAEKMDEFANEVLPTRS